MPAATLIPAGASLLGGIFSGKGGKNAAHNAQQLAQQQFQLQSNVAGNALQNLNQGANYFKQLLSGDPRQIAAAVGPTSDILKGASQSQAQQIAATTPSGGGQNLAQQQNLQNQYNQVSRLYAGVQPSAAQALAGLGAQELGVAAPNVGAASKAFQNQAGAQQQKAGQLGQGAGTILGQGIHSLKNGKQGEANATPIIPLNTGGPNLSGAYTQPPPSPSLNGVIGGLPGYGG